MAKSDGDHCVYIACHTLLTNLHESHQNPEFKHRICKYEHLLQWIASVHFHSLPRDVLGTIIADIIRTFTTVPMIYLEEWQACFDCSDLLLYRLKSLGIFYADSLWRWVVGVASRLDLGQPTNSWLQFRQRAVGPLYITSGILIHLHGPEVVISLLHRLPHLQPLILELTIKFIIRSMLILPHHAFDSAVMMEFFVQIAVKYPISVIRRAALEGVKVLSIIKANSKALMEMLQRHLAADDQQPVYHAFVFRMKRKEGPQLDADGCLVHFWLDARVEKRNRLHLSPDIAWVLSAQDEFSSCCGRENGFWEERHSIDHNATSPIADNIPQKHTSLGLAVLAFAGAGDDHVSQEQRSLPRENKREHTSSRKSEPVLITISEPNANRTLTRWADKDYDCFRDKDTTQTRTAENLPFLSSDSFTGTINMGELQSSPTNLLKTRVKRTYIKDHRPKQKTQTEADNPASIGKVQGTEPLPVARTLADASLEKIPITNATRVCDQSSKLATDASRTITRRVSSSQFNSTLESEDYSGLSKLFPLLRPVSYQSGRPQLTPRIGESTKHATINKDDRSHGTQTRNIERNIENQSIQIMTDRSDVSLHDARNTGCKTYRGSMRRRLETDGSDGEALSQISNPMPMHKAAALPVIMPLKGEGPAYGTTRKHPQLTLLLQPESTSCEVSDVEAFEEVQTTWHSSAVIQSKQIQKLELSNELLPSLNDAGGMETASRLVTSTNIMFGLDKQSESFCENSPAKAIASSVERTVQVSQKGERQELSVLELSQVERRPEEAKVDLQILLDRMQRGPRFSNDVVNAIEDFVIFTKNHSRVVDASIGTTFSQFLPLVYSLNSHVAAEALAALEVLLPLVQNRIHMIAPQIVDALCNTLQNARTSEHSKKVFNMVLEMYAERAAGLLAPLSSHITAIMKKNKKEAFAFITSKYAETLRRAYSTPPRSPATSVQILQFVKSVLAWITNYADLDFSTKPEIVAVNMLIQQAVQSFGLETVNKICYDYRGTIKVFLSRRTQGPIRSSNLSKLALKSTKLVKKTTLMAFNKRLK